MTTENEIQPKLATKIDLSHLETTSISVHLPLIIVAILNALAKQLDVTQTVLTRAGVILLLQAIEINTQENACYASVDVIDAITKAAGANTTFPDNLEKLVLDLFPPIDKP